MLLKNLENRSDIALAYLVKKYEDNEALKILINRHSGIFNSIFNKVNIKYDNCSLSNDIGEKDFEIYNACKTFDLNRKCKFITWLGNSIRFKLLVKVRRFGLKESKEIQLGGYEDVLDLRIDFPKPTNYKFYERLKLVKKIISEIENPRDKKIFELRYFSENKEDRKFKNIAKKIGLTTQCIHATHKRYLKKIRREIENYERK